MSSDSQFWWNWGVSLAVAIATFLAVLVALFGNRAQALLFPPILHLGLFSDKGELISLSDQNGKHVGWAQYYYIHVWNTRRWSPAEQTQVSLIRLEKKDGGILWSGEVPIRWRNQEYFPLLRIIGPSADCDFCRVESSGMLRLLPIFVPNNMPHEWKDRCEFVAHLRAHSTHADSEVLRLTVSWDWEHPLDIRPDERVPLAGS